MSRSTWNGSITFGMIEIPVKLHTATASETKVEFKQINSKTGNTISQKRVDSATGDAVEYEDVVKGYELSKGNFVQITAEELASVAPDKASTIEIVSTTDSDSIDPLNYDSAYYVAPGGKSNKSYWLFHEALKSQNKVAIGKFVMRSKEYVCAIRPLDGGLSVSTLRYANELRDIEDLNITRIEPAERELAAASALINALAGEFKIEDFKDEHQERVMGLIKAKADGQEIVIPEPVAEVEENVDLLDALEASLLAAKTRRAAS